MAKSKKLKAALIGFGGMGHFHSTCYPKQKNLVMGFYNATKSLGSIAGSLMAGFLYSIHAKLPFLVVVLSYGLASGAAALYLLSAKHHPKT